MCSIPPIESRKSKKGETIDLIPLAAAAPAFICPGLLGPRQRAADNPPTKVRPIPPKGISLSDSDRSALQAGVDELGKEIDALRDVSQAQAGPLELLPDVQIYHNAVRYALTYDEFFNIREVAVAKKLLGQGLERARQLREGKAPWNTATGLVVRGYVSKIDGSVQPYGLVVPASYQAEHAASLPARCLVPRPRRNAQRG